MGGGVLVAAVRTVALLGLAATPPEKEPAAGASVDPRLVFIAHKSFAVDSVTTEQIRKIYLGKMRFIGTTHVRALDQSGIRPEHQAFIKHVLHLTDSQYRHQLLLRRYQHGTLGVRIVRNSFEVIKTVAENPTTIGYVFKESIAGKSSIKVLATFELVLPGLPHE